MPGVTSGGLLEGALDASALPSALVPFLPNPIQAQVVPHPLRHGLKPPISRVSISWFKGNSLRVTLLRSECENDVVGGKVVEINLGSVNDRYNEEEEEEEEEEDEEERWRRRIAYGSVSPFALLQSRKNSTFSISKLQSLSPSPYHLDWWEYVMEYSKDIGSLLGNLEAQVRPVLEDPRQVLKRGEESTSLKAAWELMEMFYVDKLSQEWIPERLVDWLADYDGILSDTQATVHVKLVEFQKHLVTLQVIEDDHRYWDVLSSALSVGWLDIAVKLLRLHGSYQLDQLGSRETENGLVEAVAVLISKMPRMRPALEGGKLGECFKAKPDFMKAWERWRAQVTKLDLSAFWLQCDHHQTRDGLKNLLQVMLGNTNILSTATCHWMELYISHILYIRPFIVGLESMYNLAEKCIQLKPLSSPHKLMRLMIGILGENTEVVLAGCSREFGPWLAAHAIELLTAGSDEAEILLHEERQELGGISIEELHRLVYAQVLSSHVLTWQIAPIYLASCVKQGMGLLEILLYRQPFQRNQLLLKSLEICRLYDLESVCSNIMKIVGVYHWKHGRKGSGVFWLQQARDGVRLNRIAQQLFDSVGKSLSAESFKQWEGMIELLGSESKTAGGLEFLHKYRNFKKALQLVHNGKCTDTARQAAESLVSLMSNPSTPQRFWLPLLYDSLKLLNWQEQPLINVSQTNLLLNKLQELSMARLRPDFVEPDLPSHALRSVRLALATNLGRAILEEQ